MLKTQLRHIDELMRWFKNWAKKSRGAYTLLKKTWERLDTIPGVGRRTAKQILTETGTDMNRFTSAVHWTGVAPGNHESSGKRKSGKTTKGNQKLRRSLVEATRADSRSKNTYLSGMYLRIEAKRGANPPLLSWPIGSWLLSINFWKRKKNITSSAPITMKIASAPK